MAPQRRNEPDRGWVVWAIVGAVTLALCVVVIVVVGGGGKDDTASDEPADGQAVYEQSCANCHAIDGSGAIGPKLSDGRVVRRYPDIADQIEVITNGRPDTGMPPFGQELSAEQIRAVAEYERSL